MKTANHRTRDSFLELVKAFPLRPIRTEAEHEEAGKVLIRLVGSGIPDGESGDVADYVQTLTLLVADYQQSRSGKRVAKLDPVDIVRHLMDENHMTVTDLGEVIGSRPSASMFLNGRRPLSKAHIAKLCERFAVSPALFF